ncbi:MAG TPA: hypothetical protein DER33_05140 [Syntrophomonas sp.]|nr:hypothetical protein [Syntrophomonas sp.]
MAGLIRQMNHVLNYFTPNHTQTPHTNDRVTDLPTMVTMFPIIEYQLSKTKLGLIYLDIENFKSIETLYGRDICDKVLGKVANTLRDLPVCFGGPRQKFGVCSLGGDDFLIFVDAPDLVSYEQEYINMKAYYEEELNHSIESLELHKRLSLHIGYTDIQNRRGAHVESLVYQAQKEASFAAKHYINAKEHSDWQLMRKIINKQQIRSVYQPIVSLKTGDIKGYEALSRGPEGTIYEYPKQLFSAADKYKCLLELEELCNSLAITRAVNDLGKNYLFLNINPVVLNPVNYRQAHIQEVLRKSGIDFSSVVLELTERSEIKNFDELRETIRYYRSLGFLIAIDDAGAGYSSLQAIAELNPEFVKIDMSLVRDIDKIPIKRALMETFIDFCSKINAHIIAEGIETFEELRALSNSGCEFGQGFFLTRPGPMRSEIPVAVRSLIQLCYTENRSNPYSSQKNVGEIVDYNQYITPQVLVEQAKDSNPLTGLPGNRCITQRIMNELSTNEREFMILYFDLDSFKAFNDHFGFEHGDRVLVFLAQMITNMVLQRGNAEDLKFGLSPRSGPIR